MSKNCFSSLLVSVAASAATVFLLYNTAGKVMVESAVKDILAREPGLVMDALKSYHDKESARMAEEGRKKIPALEGDLLHDPLSPVGGNLNGSVTMVEFFDYHCGYCKRFAAVLPKLLDEEKNLRIIFKEFPIFGADSELAAKAALAVNSVDPTKYYAFHMLLMKASGEFSIEMLTDKAKEAGIDPAAFTKAMQSADLQKEITRNKALGETLNFKATPLFVIGTDLIEGFQGMDVFKKKIAEHTPPAPASDKR